MMVSLWISDTKALCVCYVCMNCEDKFTVLFPLTDLFKACPAPDLKALDETMGKEIAQITEAADNADPKPIILTQLDKSYLKELHIKFTAP